jgi:hypothetical protein
LQLYDEVIALMSLLMQRVTAAWLLLLSTPISRLHADEEATNE